MLFATFMPFIKVLIAWMISCPLRGAHNIFNKQIYMRSSKTSHFAHSSLSSLFWKKLFKKKKKKAQSINRAKGKWLVSWEKKKYTNEIWLEFNFRSLASHNMSNKYGTYVIATSRMEYKLSNLMYYVICCVTCWCLLFTCRRRLSLVTSQSIFSTSVGHRTARKTAINMLSLTHLLA
jgi:hypothetical protein